MKDRRRPPPDTPIGYIQGFPAKLLLDRFPVPILAVHLNGTIVYANLALEHLLGHQHDALTDHPVQQICPCPGEPDSVVTRLHSGAGAIIALTHADDSTIQALVSKSALTRADDPVALVAFHDVTEQLWNHGPATAHPI